MTDNRTTELLRKLRKMLDGCRRTETVGFDTYWITADALDSSLDELEQAIAATLGNERGTCHAESDLSEWVCSRCQCWIPLGLTAENIKYASEWRYCPHCGAKVKAVSDDE